MFRKELGNNIRELREKTGLSQEKFAYKIKMDRTYYAQVELGRRNISTLNIKRIADGLGVTVCRLFNCEDNNKETKSQVDNTEEKHDG